MTELTDLEIVNQCLDGNVRAFGVLVDRYQNVLYTAALRMVNDRQDAEDIVQTAFTKAYEKLGNFNAKYKFFSWLYRITINETLNFIKKRKRQEPLLDPVMSTRQSPEDYVGDSERQKNMQQALMQLKPDYRAVILLRHFEHHSYHEISEMLNIPEKTVKSRLFSARQLLREILINNGVIIHD